VPDQDPRKLIELVQAYFHENAPPSVRLDMTPGHSGEPYLVDPNAGFGIAAQKALARLFPGKKPALIREGGSIPIVADFKAFFMRTRCCSASACPIATRTVRTKLSRWRTSISARI